MCYLLHIFLQASWQGGMDDPPDPLGIHPHPKGNSSHHNFGLACAKGLLDALSVLQRRRVS